MTKRELKQTNHNFNQELMNQLKHITELELAYESDIEELLNRPKGYKVLKNLQLIFGGVLVLCAVMLIIGAFR